MNVQYTEVFHRGPQFVGSEFVAGRPAALASFVIAFIIAASCILKKVHDFDAS